MSILFLLLHIFSFYNGIPTVVCLYDIHIYVKVLEGLIVDVYGCRLMRLICTQARHHRLYDYVYIV